MAIGHYSKQRKHISRLFTLDHSTTRKIWQGWLFYDLTSLGVSFMEKQREGTRKKGNNNVDFCGSPNNGVRGRSD